MKFNTKERNTEIHKETANMYRTKRNTETIEERENERKTQRKYETNKENIKIKSDKQLNRDINKERTSEGWK